MKNKILTIFAIFIASVSFSQINELGLSVGGTNYIGDVGNESYIYPNDYYYGLIYKWNLTPRVAFRAQASYININDDDAKSSNILRQEHGYSFKNTIKEFALGVEFNYYDYTLTKKAWSSTPYLILEVAVFNYNVVDRETTPNNFKTIGKTSFTIPVGIGYKTRIAPKVGLSIESKLRYTFADDLDFNTSNYPQLNFGNPASDDWYLTVGINIVFGFGRKGCYSGTL